MDPNHPISSLAAELLLMIFAQAAKDTRGSRRCTSSIAVSQVCRRWREVALHAPELWTNIRCSCPLHVEEHLCRSRSRLLDVDQLFGVSSFPRLNEAIAKTLVTYSSRLKSLRWTDKSSTSVTTVWLLLQPTINFDHLESLSLSTAANFFCTISKSSTSPDAESAYPVLKELSLCRVHPSMIPPGPLPALKRLSMSPCAIMAISDILSLLSRAPGLGCLVLGDRFSLLIDAALAAPSASGIQSLDWNYAPFVDIWRFFLYIPMPYLAKLTLTISACRAWADMYHTLDGHVNPLSDEVDARLGIVPDTVVALDELQDLRIKYEGLNPNPDAPEVNLVIRQVRFPKLESLKLAYPDVAGHTIHPCLPSLPCLLEPQPFSALRTLVLRGFTLLPERTSAMLSAMPALEKLVIRRCRGSGAVVCALAPGRCVHGHGRRRIVDDREGNHPEVEEDWMCPRVSELEFSYCEDLRVECIRRVVMARAKAARWWKEERETVLESSDKEGHARSVLGDLLNVTGVVNELPRDESEPQPGSKPGLLCSIKEVTIKKCKWVAEEDTMGLPESAGGPKVIWK